MADIEEIEKLSQPSSTAMDPPADISLPLFVYGALKPGLPGFEQLRPFVASASKEEARGELLVRDGLPLLRENGMETVGGWLLEWGEGAGREAYSVVCAFEPRKHYRWGVATLRGGQQANVLMVRHPSKGGPQHLFSTSWSLVDDPAFGPGLEEVKRMLEEVDNMPGDNAHPEGNWRRFFRAQMAYLLLWSILERLSAFCIGPSIDPMERIKRMHTLPGMAEAVRANVMREGRISDSRDPSNTYRLDAEDAGKCFLYYYQVRSNLSHRGKGVFQEFDLVRSSLRELLAITADYLGGLRSVEALEALKLGPDGPHHPTHPSP